MQNIEQLLGPLRAIIPVAAGLLTYYLGWDDATSVSVATGVALVIVGVWSAYSNRRVSIAKQVAAVPGVQVVVADNAPRDLKIAAADPQVSGIVAKK